MTDIPTDKKIALVTGASRGIGRAIALELSKTGVHVIVTARTVGALEELDDEIIAAGGSATLLPLNMLKLADIDQVGPTIAERFGRLDILIGNAGMLGPTCPVHHAKPKEWQQVMDLNFHANVRLIRGLDPMLRAAPAGRAVFTSTPMASGEYAYFGPYAASKAALNAFITTYAAETLETNMKINGIDPGPVETDMLKAAMPGKLPEGTRKIEDVVPAFLDAVSENCTVHGQIILA